MSSSLVLEVDILLSLLPPLFFHIWWVLNCIYYPFRRNSIIPALANGTFSSPFDISLVTSCLLHVCWGKSLIFSSDITPQLTQAVWRSMLLSNHSLIGKFLGEKAEYLLIHLTFDIIYLETESDDTNREVSLQVFSCFRCWWQPHAVYFIFLTHWILTL